MKTNYNADDNYNQVLYEIVRKISEKNCIGTPDEAIDSIKRESLRLIAKQYKIKWSSDWDYEF